MSERQYPSHPLLPLPAGTLRNTCDGSRLPELLNWLREVRSA